MITIAQKKLTATDETLDGTFQQIVSRLKRPYITIAKKQFDLLMSASADIYIDAQGQKFTFGTADNGYALMPIL